MIPIDDPDQLAAQELRALESHAGHPVCVLSPELDLLRFSPAFAGLSSPGTQLQAGMSLADWSPEWAIWFAEPVAQAARNGQARQYPTPTFLQRIGLPPCLHLLPFPLGNGHGMAVRFEFSGPVTQSHREPASWSTARRLGRLQCLGSLAGGVAHQYNNLLLGILGHSELLVRQCKDPQAVEQLEPIRLAALRARDLSREILGLLDCDEPRLVALELDTFLENIAHLVKFSVPAGIRMEAENPSKSVRALADPDHVRLILLSCLLHVSRHSDSETGQIRVRCGQESAAKASPHPCWIEVECLQTATLAADSGEEACAMEQELRDARQSARALNGTLEHRVTQTGGLLYRLELPAATSPEPLSRRSQLNGQPDEGRGQHVLVVDDETSVREVLEKLLESRGYTVESVESGQQALARAAAAGARFQVVLLDLSMPGLSGQDTCRGLMELDPELRVILMSGNGTHKASLPAETGARAFLPKPFTIQTLFGVMRSVHSEQDPPGASL
ncbi:MAG: response regulator [Candidatus Cloacimonetes bacterium]|nr:response regulator [Candidatus Cloacimonadota bacterium]